MSRFALLMISTALTALGALMIIPDLLAPKTPMLNYLLWVAEKIGLPAWAAVGMWLAPLLLGLGGLLYGNRDRRRRP